MGRWFNQVFSRAKRLSFPVEDRRVLQKLLPGEPVVISGWILCGRDATHRRILKALREGSFQFDFTNQAMYYVGPTPAPEGRVIGACGPTTSGRMDAYMEDFLSLGVAATIGKGKRSPEVVELMKRHQAVYLATFGGAGAFLSQFVEKMEFIAWEDLGPEAFFRIKVRDFPAVVINSVSGEDFYSF
ncbi:fumarate hydratase C-terminal domain-containing protein [Thermodesulfobacterium sp.]|jgi:fumarate hydratase subunit beta|uniref:fumarate hydratase C-terminal domain-containing protein n=1 Tax=Thermodesulfobacterium sp. TaxID=1965289 RepID=UPI00257E2EB3|nr:fumarate hydratase C-terminal domain-containing protein [Thermodesulfobacterium sp.]MBZ4681183.1 fumarate hydratase [Thermodesulfobacterium sp.]